MRGSHARAEQPERGYGQNMVPLVVNGTPAELDMGFLADHTTTDTEGTGTVCQCGKNFEKQAEKATSQAKSSKIKQYRPNQRKPGKTGKDGKTPQEG